MGTRPTGCSSVPSRCGPPTTRRGGTASWFRCLASPARVHLVAPRSIRIVALAAMALVLVGQDCGGCTGCYGCWALRRQTRPLQAPGQGVTSPLAVPALAGPAGYASWLGVLVVGAGTCWSVQLRCSCVSAVQEGAERQQLRWVAFAAALSALGVVAIGALVPLSGREPTGPRRAEPVPAWRSPPVGYGGGDPALPVCTTWTGSSAAPWPMGCCTVLLAAWLRRAGPGAGPAARPATRAWSWPRPPWPWPPCSSRPAAASSRRSTGASTGAATTPPETIQAFSARLRDQVDLDTLRVELLAVVERDDAAHPGIAVAAALARAVQRGRRPHRTPMINQARSLEPVEADERAGQQHEGEEPPRVAVPAHLRPPEAARPRQRPLHLPPMPSKARRRLDPTPGDPRPDPTPPWPGPVGLAVVALVRLDRRRPGAPPAPTACGSAGRRPATPRTWWYRRRWRR